MARTGGRIDRVRLAVRGARRPRVAAVEWLDPVFVAGHWTPQLIELAGGEDVLGMPAEPSETASWDVLAEARPEVVVVMPCGYDAPRAHEEALAYAEQLRSLGAERVFAVDAAAYFSRPGPRLVDGLELLGGLLHPELLPDVALEDRAIQLDSLACPARARERDSGEAGAARVRDRDRRRDRDHADQHACGEAERGYASRVGGADRKCRDRAAYQPSDMGADGDPGEAETEDEVDDDQEADAPTA